MFEVINEKFKLRDYQLEAVEKGLAFFFDRKKRGKSEIIVAPTGSGKSLIIGSLVDELKKKKPDAFVLIFQPSAEILHQNRAKLESYGFYPSIYSASGGDKSISDITLATIGSVIKNIKLFMKFTHIIIDECHLVNPKGGMYKEFLSNLLNVWCLGLTATPWRMSNNSWFTTSKILLRTRPRIFKKFNYIVQNNKLWNDGYLSPILYAYRSDYNTSQIKINTTGRDFDMDSLKEYNKSFSLTKIIHEVVCEFKEKNHILVFTSFVDEAEKIANELNEIGINSRCISARNKKSERRQILRDFKSGEIKVVVNAKLLTTGYDFPELDCIIDGAPTLSLALYNQKIGRGVRIAKDKKNLLYVDVVKNSKKFGDVSKYELREEDTGWRVCFNNQYLTGTDVRTGEDCRARKKPKIKTIYHTITFGKYNGQKLTNEAVPTSYMSWIVDNFDNGHIKKAFEGELFRRTNKKKIDDEIPF